MDLKATVEVNKKIVALIKSKYAAGIVLDKRTLEYRYYLTLQEDNGKVKNALGHGGLVEVHDGD